MTSRRLDVAGLVELAAALTAIDSALTESRTGLDAEVTPLAPAAAALSVVFGLVERRTHEPLVDLTLLRSPDFAGATVGALALGGGMIAALGQGQRLQPDRALPRCRLRHHRVLGGGQASPAGTARCPWRARWLWRVQP